MSTATTPAASQSANGNTFRFVNHSGHTKVSYNLISNGPPTIDHPAGGPSLSYSGPEGSFTFNNNEITQNDTPMGSVVSVVLRPQKDAGSTIFSVLVPPVIVSGSAQQQFSTFAVKSYRPGNLQSPGAQITYETEHLKGTAEYIKFHTV